MAMSISQVRNLKIFICCPLPFAPHIPSIRVSLLSLIPIPTAITLGQTPMSVAWAIVLTSSLFSQLRLSSPMTSSFVYGQNGTLHETPLLKSPLALLSPERRSTVCRLFPRLQPHSTHISPVPHMPCRLRLLISPDFRALSNAMSSKKLPCSPKQEELLFYLYSHTIICQLIK